MHLGHRLHMIRTALGMSRAEVARAAGIDRMTLVRIEEGATSPRIDTLQSVFRALHVEQDGWTRLLAAEGSV